MLYDRLGVQIALGTDWLPSGSMNMLRELRCADELNKTYYGNHFTEKQLWQMVTQNAAFAVGGPNVLGTLKPGYVADIAIFNGSSAQGLPRRDRRRRRGRRARPARRQGPLRRRALLSQKGLGADTCEDLDVCGITKKACVKQDLGTIDLKTLLAETVKNPTNNNTPEPLYPLFFCKGRRRRTSRAASRTAARRPRPRPPRTYTSGTTASDKDGDGIDDAKDNCPTVFNPIRPMDGDKQADTRRRRHRRRVRQVPARGR